MKTLSEIVESVLDENVMTDETVVQDWFPKAVLKYNKSTKRFDAEGNIKVANRKQAAVPWGEVRGIFTLVDCSIDANNLPDTVHGFCITRAEICATSPKIVKLYSFGKKLSNGIYNGDVEIDQISIKGNNTITFDAMGLTPDLVPHDKRVLPHKVSMAAAKKLVFVGFDEVPQLFTDMLARDAAKKSGSIAKGRTITDIKVFDLFKNCSRHIVKEADGNKIVDKEWPLMMKSIDPAALDAVELARVKKPGCKIARVRDVVRSSNDWHDVTYCSLEIVEVLEGRIVNQYSGRWTGTYTDNVHYWYTDQVEKINVTQRACVLAKDKATINAWLTTPEKWRYVQISDEVFNTLKSWMV